LIWVAPVVGPNSATGYQLGIGYLVMPLGRFMRSDPSPPSRIHLQGPTLGVSVRDLTFQPGPLGGRQEDVLEAVYDTRASP
jgi:hypothetical protein